MLGRHCHWTFKGKIYRSLKRKRDTTLNFCCCQVSLKGNELLTFQLAFIFIPSIPGQYSFVEVLFIYFPHECFKDHRLVNPHKGSWTFPGSNKVRIRKADRETLGKKSVGAGERLGSWACEHCFRYLIPVCHLLVYPMIGQFWQYVNTYVITWLRARKVKQTWRACEPPLHRTFGRVDIWHYDARNGFSESGRGFVRFELFKKMLQALLRLLSVIFRSPFVFARQPWPRAWHKVLWHMFRWLCIVLIIIYANHPFCFLLVEKKE